MHKLFSKRKQAVSLFPVEPVSHVKNSSQDSSALENKTSKRRVHFGANGAYELTSEECEHPEIGSTQDDDVAAQPAENVEEEKETIVAEDVAKPDDVATETMEESPPRVRDEEKAKAKKKKRSSSIGKRKVTRRVAAKFCTKVPKDLTDSERIMSLLTLVAEHQKNTYLSKDQVHLDAFESIFGGLLKKAPAIIEKYESKVFKQNEKNRALEAKQRINKCKLAMLQREEAEWLKVEAELEKNAEEAYSMLQIPLDEDDEPMEEPLEDNGTELKTMMKDALQASMFMADRVALCTERSAQLQRTAERYNDRLQALVTKETHSVDELQRLKQQRYLEDAGLSNGDFELDFLKQLGPVPSNEMHVL